MKRILWLVSSTLIVTSFAFAAPDRPSVVGSAPIEYEPKRAGAGIMMPPEEPVYADATTLTVFSLTIKPIATNMWPTWRQTPALIAVTDQGTVNLSPGVATWSSSNTAIATVDATGRIVAVSPGNVDIRAVYQGVQGVYTFTVNAPVRPVEHNPIPTQLSTPGIGGQYEIPVVIIRYLPTVDGSNLDVAFDPDYWSLNQVTLVSKRSDIDNFDRWVKFMVEDATRFHGYKNAQAAPAVAYRVVDYITVYEPTPPGKVLYQAQHSPTDPLYPVYAADVYQILDRFNGRHYVEDLGVKEFWVWFGGMDAGFPSYDPTIHKPENFRSHVESNMSSPVTPDISNSSRDTTDLPIYNRTYLVYNQNFRRSQAEAMHNRGHQLEAMFSYVNQLQTGNTDLFWKKFVGQDATGAFITGRCGWTHMPPNTTTGYDYLNATVVSSDIEDWTPDRLGATKAVNYLTWGNIPYAWPTPAPPTQKIESQWYVYWMQNMPGLGNTIRYGQSAMTNWWRFVGDWDGSIRAHLGLYAACAANELCDGMDNDCDGVADEGYALGVSCDGADGDFCLEGVTICNATFDGTACSDRTASTVEICDGLDNNCDGAVDEGFPTPSIVSGDAVTSPPQQLTWNSVPLADAYDVVKGSLTILQSSTGNFTSALTACLENDSPDTASSDAQIPAPGEGYFYVVRARAACKNGSYNSGDPSQVGDRDPQIAASPVACP